MTKRPEFLTKTHENGEAIVRDFRALDEASAAAVDQWLLQAVTFGSLTWQERCLYTWINESDEVAA